MKICMFTNTYLPYVGGVARSVEYFSKDLRALGHQVLVVAPVISGQNGYEREEEVLRVPAIQHFNGSDFSVRITIPFIISGRISEFKPDVIHSHHPYVIGDTALRVAYRWKCPLIFTHHTLYEKYTHYVPLNSETMQRFVISLSTRYANLCNGVVAPSRSVADLIRERGVTTPIMEIPTGVDLAYFEKGRGERFRREHGIQDRVPVIGHVGRLAPEKNLQYLAHAVADFLRKNRGVFMVVGNGPCKKEIREIFETEGMAGSLFLVGEKTGQELADAYNAMDIFVFASRTETQGLVLVEAMAAGKPVIALNASGTREVVTDGVNGRLLEEDAQHEDFAAAMEDYFRDSEQAAMWRTEARKTARGYSRETCAKKLLRFYELLLREYSPGNHAPDELPSWEKFMLPLKTEWGLILEKAGALADAFRPDRER